MKARHGYVAEDIAKSCYIRWCCRVRQLFCAIGACQKRLRFYLLRDLSESTAFSLQKEADEH